jgi:hypothetical protein
MDEPMGTTVFWEKIKPAASAGMEESAGWFASGMARLKDVVAEIAIAKSLQQFGREEEKE